MAAALAALDAGDLSRYDALFARAGDRIASFQIADWTTPLPAGVLTDRALPGDGCVRISGLWQAVVSAGYAGPVEIEIFNPELWELPGDEVLRRALTACHAVSYGG